MYFFSVYMEKHSPQIAAFISLMAAQDDVVLIPFPSIFLLCVTSSVLLKQQHICTGRVFFLIVSNLPGGTIRGNTVQSRPWEVAQKRLFCRQSVCNAAWPGTSSAAPSSLRLLRPFCLFLLRLDDRYASARAGSRGWEPGKRLLTNACSHWNRLLFFFFQFCYFSEVKRHICLYLCPSLRASGHLWWPALSLYPVDRPTAMPRLRRAVLSERASTRSHTSCVNGRCELWGLLWRVLKSGFLWWD